MSNLVDKVKAKITRNDGTGNTNPEPSFSIQPHPAKTNDPADLQPSGAGTGLRHNDAMAAHHVRDPYIPDQHVRDNIGKQQVLSRDELRAKEAELNRK